MAMDTIVLLVSLVVVVLLLTVLLVRESARKNDAQDNSGDSNKVKLSRFGSIFFYVLLACLLVFFAVMYVLWKRTQV